MARGNKNKRKIQGPSLADKADKHVLYEDAVQCVEAEIDFVDDTFKKLRNRSARSLREDFCGTNNSSCEWVVFNAVINNACRPLFLLQHRWIFSKR